MMATLNTLIVKHEKIVSKASVIAKSFILAVYCLYSSDLGPLQNTLPLNSQLYIANCELLPSS